MQVPSGNNKTTEVVIYFFPLARLLETLAE
jgi:hypothetical protein